MGSGAQHGAAGCQVPVVRSHGGESFCLPIGKPFDAALPDAGPGFSLILCVCLLDGSVIIL